ncbi:RusA family crossover junction endodeoxyribonuclease [Bacillus infantis]|uniref:RusA family crossover junction endodeoxyribonuclease n=1 Tax=Bacillus infantis TaxID=324767 RepID=UPI003CFAF375
MELNFTLPLPTSLNALYINKFGYNPKTKTRIPTGQRILSKEGEKTKQEIIDAATDQLKGQPWSYEYTEENYIYMDTIIYFNRKGRDDNNIYKLLCDALEKVVYENDSRVLIRTQRILYDTKQPRVEVKFTPVEFRGIFPNELHMQQFEENCMTCKRYKRNCSILNKAKEGRIQEDISEDFVCGKYSKIK